MQNPSMRIEDLDPGIQRCVAQKSLCTSYRIEPSILDGKRIGNFWLDLLTFKRHTVTTGWEFRGLLVVIDNESRLSARIYDRRIGVESIRLGS